MKSDLLDHARFLHHGLRIKDMDFLCYNLQEHITDILAVQLEKADREQKPNSKKLISVN